MVKGNLAKFFAHLIGLRHHGHEFDVVVEDSQEAGISLSRSNAGFTFTPTNGLHLWKCPVTGQLHYQIIHPDSPKQIPSAAASSDWKYS